MSARVFGGEEVKILTSGGEIDPNTYNVQFVKRDLIGLACKETGITIKVNNQRIYKVIKENEMNETENNSNVATIESDNGTQTMEPTEITVEPSQDENTEGETAKEEKPKKAKKTKTPPQPIDFDAMVNDGFEVWTRSGLSLGDDPKVSAIAVAAHCVIDPEDVEERGYEVFNSYNGTRGAKGKGGKRYLFTEKMTIEKKRKTLAKKGYVQHEV